MSGPAVAWLIAAVLAAVVEIAIPSFGFLFVSCAAAGAALAAVAGLGGAIQAVAFGAVLVLSLAFLRSRLAARLGARGVPSRTQTLVGKRAKVTADIDPTLGTGRVNVGGEDWAARSRHAIPSGVDVQIQGFDGIVLEVSPVETTDLRSSN
jgi:membrane protein implicated in regulation of membrane protease activity